MLMMRQFRTTENKEAEAKPQSGYKYWQCTAKQPHATLQKDGKRQDQSTGHNCIQGLCDCFTHQEMRYFR